MLKSTQDSVISVANRVGYSNPGKFAAAFKNVLGVTPTEYRKSFFQWHKIDLYSIISLVSNTYAWEIQTEEYGEGLDVDDHKIVIGLIYGKAYAIRAYVFFKKNETCL